MQHRHFTLKGGKKKTTKELFQYNPEKAKQLLKEAGYPNGFKTTMNILARDEPYASLVKSFWSQIGVDASINVLEVANYTSQLYGFKFDTWLGRWGFSWGNWSWVFEPGAHWNFTRITDPTLSKLLADATMNYTNWNKWVKDWKAINIRVLDQAYEHLITRSERSYHVAALAGELQRRTLPWPNGLLPVPGLYLDE